MKIGNKRIAIKEHPKLMQCKVCLKFEHTAKQCKSLGSPKCFKCSDECTNPKICYNCNGSHHVYVRENVYFRYFQEALTRSRKFGITVKEAKEDM